MSAVFSNKYKITGCESTRMLSVNDILLYVHTSC